MPSLARSRMILVLTLLLPIWTAPARALSPGSAAPPFRLPRLTGEAAPPSNEIFAAAPLTAIAFWNRGCPRCTEIGLRCDALADSLRPLGVPVVAILFGPDDPVAASYLLEERNIRLPHLWDDGPVARAYGLGTTHLAAFLVDSAGTVQAAFDDQMEDLVAALVPSARRLLGGGMADRRPSDGPGHSKTRAAGGAAGGAAALRESIELDCRTRFATTDGSRPEDRGLLGEPLEPGATWLYRADLRLRWSPARGIEVVPWLRWGNEDEAAAKDGAEQLSDRYGSLSVNLRRGRWHGTLGAFPLRLSPLLLQRWDPDDAPPLGGATGCGVCGSGVSGITARSLELLAPPYTFEGLEAGSTTRFAQLRVATAVARREQASAAATSLAASRLASAAADQTGARYRKDLSAVVLDLGRAGSVDPGTGLSRPAGLRLSALFLNDDQRSNPLESPSRPADERDERALSAWGSVGPWGGAALEAEAVWWRLCRVRLAPPYGHIAKDTTDARGWSGGVRVERIAGPWRMRGRFHLLRTEPGFEPYYQALTYNGNREGWRGTLGLFWADTGPAYDPREPGGGAARAPERLGLELFHRAVRETEDDPARRENPGADRERETVTSLSLSARPRDSWPAELHLIRSRTDHPVPLRPDETRAGFSLHLRCTAVPALEPSLRLDWIWIRTWPFDTVRDESVRETHAVRTISVWVRLVG